MNKLAVAWNSYRSEELTTRLHVLLRLASCPFGRLLPFFPTTGTVLDVGCGHGLLLNLLAAHRHQGLILHGVDHDPRKIAVAARTVPASCRCLVAPLADLPPAAYDAISLVDVLYTIPEGLWPEVLAGCHRLLRPGGLLLVKEVTDRPRWKYWLIMAQESLSVRVFGLTKGEPPHFTSAARYQAFLEQAGFQLAQSLPLDQWSWISHHLFTAVKPVADRENGTA